MVDDDDVYCLRILKGEIIREVVLWFFPPPSLSPTNG